jgi:hypothetical protein
VKQERVRVDELVDLARLGRAGAPPTPSDIRAALPRGWVLDDDGEYAHRDRRWMFTNGWILICAMAAFAAVAIGIYASTAPRGWRGLSRVAILLALLVLIGGVVGPLVTRALIRRGPK